MPIEVEEVKAFRSSDGSVHPTWKDAMYKETALVLVRGRFGNAFATIQERAHHDKGSREALIEYVSLLKQMY